MRIFKRLNRNGFTLIELMVVMSIIGILAAIATPNYRWGYIKAKEAVLRENLYSIRSTIDQYYADNGKYPDNLDELTKSDKQYLRDIPKDPFTGQADWITMAPPSTGDSSSASGIYNVHSASPKQRQPELPYNEW